MKTLHSLAPLLVLSVLLAACGSADTPDTYDTPPAEEPVFEAAPEVIEIEVTAQGYEPEQIELEEGVPTRLIFTRTADSGCAENVQSPDLGIAETELPLGEPVEFDVTPTESGAFTFMCGMNMLEGTIVVSS